jgi:23S rRNA pseudouridine2605 synthase
MAAERLQKVLAAAGVASRRGAEALIEAGRVRVDGRVAELGERADPATARITVDGRPIGAASTRIHLALNKPAGVTSTVRDRHADRTVVELVPADLRPPTGRLYPVGRLDRESEGLLLLTNDGPWADRVLHPRNHVEREYALALRQPLDARQVAILSEGIELDEGLATLIGLRPATAAETRLLGGMLETPPDVGLAWYRATLGQGMKRQLRRMFGAVGAPIERLVRVRVGSVRLDRLPPGGVRRLTATETRDLGGSTRGT